MFGKLASVCIAAAGAAAISAGSAWAQAGPFGDIARLVGEWRVAPEAGGPAFAVQRFVWGPNQSYIWQETDIFAHS